MGKQGAKIVFTPCPASHLCEQASRCLMRLFVESAVCVAHSNLGEGSTGRSHSHTAVSAAYPRYNHSLLSLSPLSHPPHNAATHAHASNGTYAPPIIYQPAMPKDPLTRTDIPCSDPPPPINPVLPNPLLLSPSSRLPLSALVAAPCGSPP
jgi:hypothetical protein